MESKRRKGPAISLPLFLGLERVFSVYPGEKLEWEYWQGFPAASLPAAGLFSDVHQM